MANHYHAMIVNRGSAEELSAFMNFVDGEIAKVVCKLLGTWNVKIWSQRFHYAPLLSAEDALEKMAYLFLNPVSANLVARASEFPGVSTYGWLTPGHQQSFQYVRPKLIVKLANGRFLRRTSKRLASALKELTLPSYNFSVKPFAWKECFSGTVECSDEALKAELMERIAKGEARAERDRKQTGQRLCDLDALVEQNPHRHYVPKKYGRRACCISSCPVLRAEYIKLYRSFCKQCDAAWQQMKRGYREVVFPAGAFLPPQMPRANVMRFAT